MSDLQTKAEEFIQAHPVPESGGTWNQGCGRLMFEFGAWLGWKTAPSGDLATAQIVGSHSGALQGLAADAPIGAYHFFTLGTFGHVGQDLLGGGTNVFMATNRNGGSSLGSFIRVMSVDQYLATGGVEYRGWSMNYSGGVAQIPIAPAAPVVTPTTRIAGPSGVNARAAASASSAILPGKGIIAGGGADFGAPGRGYVHGDTVTVGSFTSDIWYASPDVHAYFAAAAFEGGPNLTGLTDLTPAVVSHPGGVSDVDYVKAVATYLNGRKLGQTSGASGSGLRMSPGATTSIYWWMVQTAGVADGLFSGEVTGVPDAASAALEPVYYRKALAALAPASPVVPDPVVPAPVEPVPAPVPDPFPVAPDPVPVDSPPVVSPPVEPVTPAPAPVEPVPAPSAPVDVPTPPVVVPAPTVKPPVAAVAPPKTTVVAEVNKWLQGGVIAALIALAGTVIAFCFGH